MILLLDIGNSRTKWGFLTASGLGATGARSHGGGTEILPADISQQPDEVYAANVAGEQAAEALRAAVGARWHCRVIFARSVAKAGRVRNAYSDPQQLGVDRWLAMVGAYAAHQSALCIVDAGTATTVDLLARDGRHLGGFITPGMDLMIDSLLTATGDLARLREVSDPESDPAPAHSTGAAIRDGAMLATLGLVDRARTFLPRTARTLVTGGRGAELAHHLDADYDPDLVLAGLAVNWRAGAAEG